MLLTVVRTVNNKIIEPYIIIKNIAIHKIRDRAFDETFKVVKNDHTTKMKTRTTMYILIIDEKSTERMNIKDMERTRNNALSEDPEFKFTKNQWTRRLGC